MIGAKSLLAGLLVVAAFDAAADCPFYNPFCKPAEKIADGAVKAADVASDKMASAINYWPWLIQKYYTGTKEEQAMAKTLVRRVFGVDTIEGIKPFEMTFSFDGVDPPGATLDVVVLGTYAAPSLEAFKQQLAARIASGAGGDFIVRQVRANSPQVQEKYSEYIVDTNSLRESVRAALHKARGTGRDNVMSYEGRPFPGDNYKRGCINLLPDKPRVEMAPAHQFGGSSSPCEDQQEWKAARASLEALTDAVMLTVDRKFDRMASRPSVSVPYEGYYYVTVVIPEEQLAVQKKLNMYFRIHVKGKPNEKLPLFERDDWSISQAALLRGGAAFPSIRMEQGKKYWAFTIPVASEVVTATAK